MVFGINSTFSKLVEDRMFSSSTISGNALEAYFKKALNLWLKLLFRYGHQFYKGGACNGISASILHLEIIFPKMYSWIYQNSFFQFLLWKPWSFQFNNSIQQDEQLFRFGTGSIDVTVNLKLLENTICMA